VFAKGYGHLDRERGVPTTATTSYHIGSLTKQFTAAAIGYEPSANALVTAKRIDPSWPLSAGWRGHWRRRAHAASAPRARDARP